MSTLKLGPIVQAAITVSNLERAIAFYRDVLGLPLLFKAPPQMAFFDCHGVRLLIGEGKRGMGEGGTLLYFKVEDIEGTVAALEKAAVEIHTRPLLVHKTATSELYLAACEDPDGNILELMEERAL
jgi:predicted enzyme related to lactoylglutathione lyase